MSFHEKLQVHVSSMGGDWFGDGHPFSATWDEAGPCVLVAVPHVLRAADVVDAHVAARARGASVTLAFGGSVTSVARQTADRLGVRLLDVSAMPDVVASPPVVASAVDAPTVAAVDAEIPTVATLVELPVAAVAGAWLAAHVDAVENVSAENVTAESVTVEPVTVEPTIESAIVESVPAAIPWAGMPWAGQMRVPVVPRVVSVTQEERASMPWSAGAISSSWAFPWPQPEAASEGDATTAALSRADPKLWRARERVESLRAFLVRGGAPSFGAVPSEAPAPRTSTWLDGLKAK